MRNDRAQQPEQKEFEQRVIAVDRVARVVKGGRRFRFRALVVVGDGKGQVGVGTAKAGDVSNAVTKAVSQGQKSMMKLKINKNGSIPFEAFAKFSGASVMLKPAKPGTGIIAGGSIRDVLEVAGFSNVVAKRYGSSNKLNNANATLEALKLMLIDLNPRKYSTTGKQTDSLKKAEAKA